MTDALTRIRTLRRDAYRCRYEDRGRQCRTRTSLVVPHGDDYRTTCEEHRHAWD